eukprot:gb/GECG01005250.1/.p1 GENE.gb/GECG01005250.1/~~gb/GECG01005250.1/.p1  ORF type:complete len:113 (+),score=5.25 gb/GECG01005250.1/:1-339(+)
MSVPHVVQEGIVRQELDVGSVHQDEEAGGALQDALIAPPELIVRETPRACVVPQAGQVRLRRNSDLAALCLLLPHPQALRQIPLSHLLGVNVPPVVGTMSLLTARRQCLTLQ